jgi:hypothetical protein
MMLSEKLIRFLAVLIRRTHEGKIPWEQAAEPNIYVAPFPQYAVTIKETSVNFDKYDFLLQIHNAEGEVIDEVSEAEMGLEDHRTIQEIAAVLEAHQRPLEYLFRAARRHARGIDRALDMLLADLERR